MKLVGASLVALAISLAPGLARAGGSSGTGGDTGGGTDPDGTTDGSCGTCSPPDSPVTISSPLDGAEVLAQTTVSFAVSDDCSCDDCGCFQDQPFGVTLTVDGEEAYACADSCTGGHEVDLTLSPGTHELVAAAQYSFHTQSATVTVSVAGVATGDEGGSAGASSAGGSGGSGSAGSGSGGGGGCRIDREAPLAPAALTTLLLGLGGLTRRRRTR